jgi:hypothetical protein
MSITQANVMKTLDPLAERLYADIRAITADPSAACDVRISEASQRVIFNIRWDQGGTKRELLVVITGTFTPESIAEATQKLREKVYS